MAAVAVDWHCATVEEVDIAHHIVESKLTVAGLYW